jgi:hypothetical protein
MNTDEHGRKPIVRSLLALLLVLVSVPATAQTVTLRYNWQQGQELTYKTIVRTNSTMSGAGDSRSFEQTLSQTLKISVSAVFPDGSATLRQVISAVTLDMDTPGGKMSYDSAKPVPEDADPRLKAMGKTMGAMVGEAISVTMAPNGTVKRIDGTARIVDKLMQELPRDPMAGSLAQNIRAMLGEDALRTSLEQNFSRMPDVPVKPGDTWTSQQSVGADATGKIVGTSTFTLKAIEGTGEAAIARIGVSLSLKQADAPATGASMVVKLHDGKGQGEVQFSVARGRVEKNEMKTEMTSSASVRGPEGSMQNIQNNARTIMTMDLIKQEGR